MPNKILNYHNQGHHAKQHDDGATQARKLRLHTQSVNIGSSNNNLNHNNNNNKNRLSGQPEQQQQTSANSLNVAEMILHGVADHEILDTWLRSIACQEFAKNFVDAGYDMPTISRITPQDLTSIGITDPTKRLKILSEIKKLNLQDGIPTFKPANLSHWLSLLRLDSHYHKSLCDQQIDTIEKTCQLTWEDLEELGITKLGHQKRLLLAIERMKELDTEEAQQLSKPMSEPIYDTNPSQILLVASAENHSMNGPIINKQSSTSELSSTGSGSMHSLYSANSIQYQSSYQTLPSIQQHIEMHKNQQQQQQHPSAIYSQPPSQLMMPPQQLNQTPIHQIQMSQTPISQTPIHQTQMNQLANGIHRNQQRHLTPQHHQNSHYQAVQPQFINPIYDTNNLNGRNTMINRQSLGQLPFSALANLPKHQQQLLQQSSIYATLSRQPQRVKQPPPPVPIRTNSLKSNSLIDEETKNHSSLQSLTANNQTNSSSSLFRSGTRVSDRTQYNSQTLLSKNKSFCGGAYMDAARARFLNRNNQQQQCSNLPQQMHLTNQISTTNRFVGQNQIYGTNLFRRDEIPASGHQSLDGDNLSLYSRQSIPASMMTNQTSSSNQQSDDPPHPPVVQQMNQRHSIQPAMKTQLTGVIDRLESGEDYGRYSDTNSTKSLILTTSNRRNSPVISSGQASSSQDSSSSQTLYNSASSGSNDQNVNGCNHLSQSRHSTVSNSTLNDVNLILDQQVAQNQQLQRATEQLTESMPKVAAVGSHECNATTGENDKFPPPPSPLSLTDFEDHNLNSIDPESNFSDISQGLMAFRVGT